MSTEINIPASTFEKNYNTLWILLQKTLNTPNPLKIIYDTITNIKRIHNTEILSQFDVSFLKFLYGFEKIVKICQTLPIPDNIMYKQTHIINCDFIMKNFNYKIVAKNWKSSQEFLELINIPVQSLHIYNTPGLVMIRLFPHESQSRPIRRIDDAFKYAERLLMAESEDKVKLITFKDIFSNKLLPVIGSGELLSVILHESRRHVHALPIDAFLSWIPESLNYAHTLHFLKHGTYNQPELIVNCPICKEISSNCTNCRDHVSSTCHKIHCAKCLCAKSHSHTVSINMQNIDKLPRRFPRINLTGLPTKKMFFDTMLRVTKINPKFLHFTCSNTECKHATTPYIIVLTHTCIRCVKSYRDKSITTFHTFKCPGCTKIECGLCAKPESDHIGETLICPKQITRTAEEITEARASGIRFCPMCDVPTMMTDGCDHITCEVCFEHWCFACERHLPIDPLTGTRYTHRCTEPPIGRDAWARDDEPLPEQFRMNPEENPAKNHKISLY
jgi:hypothetical protein